VAQRHIKYIYVREDVRRPEKKGSVEQQQRRRSSANPQKLICSEEGDRKDIHTR